MHRVRHDLIFRQYHDWFYSNHVFVYHPKNENDDLKLKNSSHTWRLNFCKQSLIFCDNSPHALLKSFFKTRLSTSRLSAF
jgi:hypothetical protein